jgi:hypothetical protein
MTTKKSLFSDGRSNFPYKLGDVNSKYATKHLLFPSILIGIACNIYLILISSRQQQTRIVPPSQSVSICGFSKSQTLIFIVNNEKFIMFCQI